jgi:hypothetical protein
MKVPVTVPPKLTAAVAALALTALGAAGCGKGAAVPPEEPPRAAKASGGEDRTSCEAGVLELDEGRRVVAIASEQLRYLILLPVAEDWQVDCTGKQVVVEAGSDALAMHLFLHHVPDAPDDVDERAMLERLADGSRKQAASQGGVQLVQEDLIEVEGHLLHESLMEAQAEGGTAQAWSYWTVRESPDGSLLMLHYTWVHIAGDVPEHEVANMRHLMQAVGGAFDILPRTDPA